MTSFSARSAPRPLALGLLFFFALGCRDSTGPEVFDPVGTLGFTHAGPAAGAFVATGELDPGPGMMPQPVTGATAWEEQGVLSLIASRVGTAGRMDVFWMMLGDVQRTGVLPIDPSQCAGESLATCRVGIFIPGIDAVELMESPDIDRLLETAFVMIAGQVDITRLTRLRVRGTFSGYAVRLSEDGVPGSPLLITGGTFDLPRRPR